MLALALLISVGLATHFQRLKSPAFAQPLAEMVQGAFPLLPPQPPVNHAFPIEFEAQLVAQQSTTLRAPVDAVLQRLRSSAEEQVAAGEVLAVLSSTELTQKRLDNDSKVQELSAMLGLYSPSSSPDLRKLQAALEGGKRKYQYAETSFEKVQELFRRGLISGKEHADARVQLQADKLALQAASREYADAQALSAANYLKLYNQLQVAKLEREQLRTTQEKLQVKAPFAGRVRAYAPARIHDTDQWLVGDSVKAQEPLFYLESDRQWVKAEVSNALLGHFSLNDSVTVYPSNDGTASYQGVVREIAKAPYEEGASSALESVATLFITVPEAALATLRKHKVRVSKAVMQQGIAVPVDAVVSMGGERFVYVKGCNDEVSTFTRRRVVLSAEEAGVVLITSGIVPGECIAQTHGALE